MAAVGVLLEAAATVPFALLDLPAVSAALTILVGAVVAFAAGPRWGVLVAAVGVALFFIFPADQDLRVLVTLPVWLLLAAAAGLTGDRFRRMARDLRLGASELDALRDSPSLALVDLDLDGRITNWSPGAEQIYGYGADEAEGEEISLLAPGEPASEIQGALQSLGEGERRDLDGRSHRRKDGSDALVSLSLSPLFDGGEIVGACAVIRDVTQHERTQEELEQAENKYRALAESLPLVTLISAPGDRTSVAYPARKSRHCSAIRRPSGRTIPSSSRSSCTRRTGTTSSPA